jgi:hypothetical protein
MIVLTACDDSIHRTAFDSWETRALARSRVLLEMPKRVRTYPIPDGRGLIVHDSIEMHCRSIGIADNVCYIKISIDEKPRDSFDKTPFNDSSITQADPAESDPTYRAWFIHAYHANIVTHARSDGASHYFRRDVQLFDGTVASIHAEYICFRFSEEEQVADDAAIRRILASARPCSGPERITVTVKPR